MVAGGVVRKASSGKSCPYSNPPNRPFTCTDYGQSIYTVILLLLAATISVSAQQTRSSTSSARPRSTSPALATPTPPSIADDPVLQLVPDSQVTTCDPAGVFWDYSGPPNNLIDLFVVGPFNSNIRPFNESIITHYPLNQTTNGIGNISWVVTVPPGTYLVYGLISGSLSYFTTAAITVTSGSDTSCVTIPSASTSSSSSSSASKTTNKPTMAATTTASSISQTGSNTALPVSGSASSSGLSGGKIAGIVVAVIAILLLLLVIGGVVFRVCRRRQELAALTTRGAKSRRHGEKVMRMNSGSGSGSGRLWAAIFGRGDGESRPTSASAAGGAASGGVVVDKERAAEEGQMPKKKAARLSLGPGLNMGGSFMDTGMGKSNNSSGFTTSNNGTPSDEDISYVPPMQHAPNAVMDSPKLAVSALPGPGPVPTAPLPTPPSPTQAHMNANVASAPIVSSNSRDPFRHPGQGMDGASNVYGHGHGRSASRSDSIRMSNLSSSSGHGHNANSSGNGSPTRDEFGMVSRYAPGSGATSPPTAYPLGATSSASVVAGGVGVIAGAAIGRSNSTQSRQSRRSTSGSTQLNINASGAGGIADRSGPTTPITPTVNMPSKRKPVPSYDKSLFPDTSLSSSPPSSSALASATSIGGGGAGAGAGFGAPGTSPGGSYTLTVDAPSAEFGSYAYSNSKRSSANALNTPLSPPPLRSQQQPRSPKPTQTQFQPQEAEGSLHRSGSDSSNTSSKRSSGPSRGGGGMGPGRTPTPPDSPFADHADLPKLNHKSSFGSKQLHYLIPDLPLEQ